MWDHYLADLDLTRGIAEGLRGRGVESVRAADKEDDG